MPTNHYSDTINWLFEQFPSYQIIGAPAYKPGLDNVRQLCQVLGNPQDKLKFVHVAGSNGKGSTASMLASFFTENELKTGLFTSPHLVDFRERIRVNGQMISEQDVILFCEKIKALEFEPSFFEISFCMALVHFVEQKCDICVIETGLGGRLDATNIIHPLLSIITTISLEHTNFLGNTLPEIAGEKAGIIKENVPVVIGSTMKETKEVFEEKAEKMNSKIYFAEDYPLDIPENFPLLGTYQRYNFRTVQLAIEVLKTKFDLDLSRMDNALKNLHLNTGFQGRLQIVSHHPRLILDVSHNAEGIQSTLDYFESEMDMSELHVVYGSSADKNLAEIFGLFPKTANYYLTEFANVRSAKKEDLVRYAEEVDLHFSVYANANEALQSAQRTSRKEDTILVFGSFFLLHDILKEIS
jgi:dihydrofolate synthase / folylpolyglutamate synthase